VPKLTNNAIFNVPNNSRSSAEHTNLPLCNIIGGHSPHHAIPEKNRKLPTLESNQPCSFFSQLTVMKTRKKIAGVLIEDM
jgi:hypothetical protein